MHHKLNESFTVIITFSLMILLFTFGCNKDNNANTEDPGPPKIISFYSDADTIGATVHIYGMNFSKDAASNKVIFNSKETVPFYSTTDSLLVKVPAGAATGKIAVRVNDKTAVSADTFYVTTGRWTRLGNFPGEGRISSLAFSANNTGYIGMGTGNSNTLKDFWKYDQAADNWIQLNDFPGGYRREAISFVIGNNAYAGLGYNPNTTTSVNDLYAFDAPANQWTRKADEPFFLNSNPVALAINNKGYIITGSYNVQVAEFDPSAGWQLKASFPGVARAAATGFVIGNKGYIAGGNSGSGNLSDFWEYNPVADTWSQKAMMPYGGYNATGFSINGKGYVCIGYRILEYDPLTDRWTRKTNFPGSAYAYRVSFVLNNVAYIAFGLYSNQTSKEIWKFEP